MKASKKTAMSCLIVFVSIVFAFNFGIGSKPSAAMNYSPLELIIADNSYQHTNSFDVDDYIEMPEEIILTDKEALNYIRKHLGEENVQYAKTRHTEGKKGTTRYIKSPTNYTSLNWGGYAVKAPRIDLVQGKFSVTANHSGQIAVWTGIGGIGGINLAQAGVESTTIAQPS